MNNANKDGFSRYVTLTGDVSFPLDCLAAGGFTFDFGQASVVWQTIAMTIDRLIVVSFPMDYHHLELKHLQISNAICWLIPLVATTTFEAVGLAPAKLIPLCNYNLIFQSASVTIKGYCQIVFVIVVVLMYLLIMPLAYWRLRANKSRSRDLRSNLQLRTALTALMIASFYCFTWLAYQVFSIVVQTYVPQQARVSISPYNNLALPINTYGMFVFATWKNDEFRKALLGHVISLGQRRLRSIGVATAVAGGQNVTGARK